MNKVLFCGAGYGAGNIGDDAILSGLLFSAKMYLREDTQYGALTFNPEFTKENAELNEAFAFNTDVEVAFNWATHIVLGGASLLSGWSIDYCSNLIVKAQKMKKPICMLAAGTSRTPTIEQRQQLATHFGSLDMITLRSDDDRDLAIKWGLNPTKLWVCADGAFAIDRGYEVYSPSDTIGINLVHENLPDEYKYVDVIKQLLLEEYLHMDFAYICGEVRKDEGFDSFLLKELVEVRNGILYDKYVKYLDLLTILTKCDFVIVMRMHMMLFCALVGVPCIPFVREPKTQLMADELGLKHTLPMDITLPALKEIIDEVQMNPEIAIANADMVDALRTRSFRNGEMLCTWMRLEL